MATFVICLEEPNEEVWNKIGSTWKDSHFFASDRLALVSSNGITLAKDVSDVAGLTDEKSPVRGLVVEFSAYYGYHQKELWEWLRKAQA